ncbi:MAG: DsbA family protein [bacterium]|nr:DsbA family protein [bacterium]
MDHSSFSHPDFPTSPAHRPRRWARRLVIAAAVIVGAILVAFTIAVVRQIFEENAARPGIAAGGSDPIEGKGRPSVGALNAPVTIVEFYDFECPFCREAAPIVDLIAADPAWAGKVRFVFRHFPIPDAHPNAIPAGRAAECAYLQGKFMEMRQLLFANQARLRAADLPQYARQLQLDEDRFSRCLADPASYTAVEQDWRAGLRAGVEGTPTYFINGNIISGLPTRLQLEQAISAALVP